MTLKEVHIIFITCSVFLMFGFAYWALRQYQQTSNPSYLAAALLTILLNVSLIFYEKFFLKKIKT